MLDDDELARATAPLGFAEFLDRMKDPAAADLVRSIKNFIKVFSEKKLDPESSSQQVQQFLAKSEGAFRQHPVWAAGPPGHQTQAIEGLEKYMLTKIYHKTFAVSELDRERDEALHARMTALNFIKPQHLDIPQALQDENSWQLAMKELRKINNFKAPRDKMICILNCCRIINNLLNGSASQGEARGADDFLPILIYVTIHANPPQLASNLEYIQRFRMHSRMVAEPSYFFTQLYSAASFIETINSNSLTMEADEFVARMVAAGVPDMQLLPAAKEIRKASQGFPDRKLSGKLPSLTDKPDPASQQPASQPESEGIRSKDGSRESKGPLFPSLAHMEQAGVRHVLEAEANGELHLRHPFIYASAEDLRVSDVDELLAAYKQLVLRYEALSLALSHCSVGSGLSPSSEKPLFADPPPAVDGPNPFGRYHSQRSVGSLEEPQSFGSVILQKGAAAQARQGSRAVSVSDVLPLGVPGANASVATPVLKDLLTSAMLTVPALSTLTFPQPGSEHFDSLPHSSLTEEPSSAAPATIAAVAIETATAAIAGSRGNSLETPRAPSGPLAESRLISPFADDVRQGVRESAAAPQPEPIAEDLFSASTSFSSAKTQPTPRLASLTSRLPDPRSYTSAPNENFLKDEEFELPDLAIPDPFGGGGFGSDSFGAPGADPFASHEEANPGAADAATELFTDQEINDPFGAYSLASPFNNDTKGKELGARGSSPDRLFGQSENSPFGNSPFYAGADDAFRDSPQPHKGSAKLEEEDEHR